MSLKLFDTIGSDPEFIVFNKTTRKPVSMVGKIPGSKEEPSPIEVEGCCTLPDNVLVEFTVPPAYELQTLYGYIEQCRYCITKQLGEEYELRAKSSQVFPNSELQTVDAQTFGCLPSNSLYAANGWSIIPLPEEVGNLRSAGFHLHFGWNDVPTEDERKDFVFLCDLFLGIPSFFQDKDNRRRKIYGKLGEFRFKDYGIEYRVLGAGMYNYPEMIQQGLDNIKSAIARDKVEFLKEMFFETLRMNYEDIKVKKLMLISAGLESINV